MKFSNILELTKAYTEGIYADTPANRKLGRVGMTYAAYAEKLKGKKSTQNEEIKEAIKTRSLIKQRWNPITIEREIKQVLPSINGLEFKKVNRNDYSEDEEYYYLSIPKKNIGQDDLFKLKNIVAKFGLSDKNIKNYKEDLIYLESPKWDEGGNEVEMSYLWPAVREQRKRNLLYNEIELDNCLNKIEDLEKQKQSSKGDTGVLSILDKSINKQKKKIEQICPNYEKSAEYVEKILDTDENRGKRVNIPKDCVDSIKFLLKFNGLTSSEYKYEDTGKGHYISLI